MGSALPVVDGGGPVARWALHGGPTGLGRVWYEDYARFSKWSPPAPDVRDAAVPTPRGPAVLQLPRRPGGLAPPAPSLLHQLPSSVDGTFAGSGVPCGYGVARPAVGK